jgi:glutamate---cysteine ligase / carboxylate-amine ligase
VTAAPLPLTADAIRERFDAVAPLTVGLEEEAMLLDPGTLALAPVAEAVLARTDDPRVKLELPASQAEVVTAPFPDVPSAIAELAAGRRALAAAAEGLARPAGGGAHPFSPPLGELNAGERYDEILADYGDVARAQLVCSLQVHVAVGGGERTLAVYNALRGHLPELTALAANAPFHAGRDTGFATVRPLIGALLPRQGVPPAIRSFDVLAEALRWGVVSGAVPEPRRWWYELRPHLEFGTLELRAADTPATVADAAAIAAFVHALVAWLAERHDNGEWLGCASDQRIEHNRFAACRRGMDAELADLDTGEPSPARDVLRRRLEQLAPAAERLGCARELAGAEALVKRTGADRLRATAGRDPHAAAQALADAYLP